MKTHNWPCLMRRSSVVTPCKRFRGTENATLAPESWVSLIFLLPLVTRLLGLGLFHDAMRSSIALADAIVILSRSIAPRSGDRPAPLDPNDRYCRLHINIRVASSSSFTLPPTPEPVLRIALYICTSALYFSLLAHDFAASVCLRSAWLSHGFDNTFIAKRGDLVLCSAV